MIMLTKITITTGLIILVIGSSFLPIINGLYIESNNSDIFNSKINRFDGNIEFEEVGFIPTKGVFNITVRANGPLGEWPDFTPIGFITAHILITPNIRHIFMVTGEVLLVKSSFFCSIAKSSYFTIAITKHI